MDLTSRDEEIDEAVMLDHPFLANRFITIPPIQELHFVTGLGYDDDSQTALDHFLMDAPRSVVITNKDGVTVGYVCLKFAEEYERTIFGFYWTTTDCDPSVDLLGTAIPAS